MTEIEKRKPKTEAERLARQLSARSSDASTGPKTYTDRMCQEDRAAADTIERLLAALKGAEGARDEAERESRIVRESREFWLKAASEENTHVIALAGALRAAERERDAAVAALQPFVKFANLFGNTARDDDWVITHNPSGKNNLTMGDVRQARAALASNSGGGE